MEVKRLPLGDFTVNTGDQIDGYGYKHLDDFINNLRFMTGDRPVKKAMEWCSGPGYIGLGLIAINYAETVLLSDIHPPVEDIVNLTIKENNLSTRVSFVVSDNFKNINDKFDLIVGNPPHFNFHLRDSEHALYYEEHRKHMDVDWKIHKDFFENAANHLTDNGTIFLMENVSGSSPTLFYDMLYDHGLRIADHRVSPEWPEDIWYLKIVRSDLH